MVYKRGTRSLASAVAGFLPRGLIYEITSYLGTSFSLRIHLFLQYTLLFYQLRSLSISYLILNIIYLELYL